MSAETWIAIFVGVGCGLAAGVISAPFVLIAAQSLSTWFYGRRLREQEKDGVITRQFTVTATIINPRYYTDEQLSNLFGGEVTVYNRSEYPSANLPVCLPE